jgi:hypothetical protein
MLVALLVAVSVACGAQPPGGLASCLISASILSIRAARSATVDHLCLVA